jgi:hypothetical protein
MADIKSAYEIAMEKINNIESATAEEKMQWKFVPKGETIAAKYMKDDINLPAELAKFTDAEKKYVIQGISAILARNIDLPKNDAVKKNNKKAMDGLSMVKKDKKGLDNVFSKIKYIFNHYTEQGEAQKKAAYEQVKEEFALKLQQALAQQGSAAKISNIDIERQPQFQEEWRKMLIRLDAQYLQHLNEYKHELLALN